MAYTFERTCSGFIKDYLDKRLRPRIVVQSHKKFVVRFDNITSMIDWTVSRSKSKFGWYYDSSVFAALNWELNDLIYSSDLQSVRYPWGQYYCSLCPLEKRVRYSSLKELLIEHMLLLANDFFSKKLIENNYLAFIDYGGGGSVELAKDKSEYIDAVDGSEKVTYVSIFK